MSSRVFNLGARTLGSRTLSAVALSSLALGSLALGCTLEFEEPRAFACPQAPVEQFRNVSAVLEKRCGSLDCHGEMARPLRIMGSNGLRLFTAEEFDSPSLAEEVGGIPGGQKPTSEQELEQNRQSICGIEPERTEQVVRGELDPTDLMLIRKPTLRERHKGMQVFLKGGAGESCVTSWLEGDAIVADCVEAVQSP